MIGKNKYLFSVEETSGASAPESVKIIVRDFFGHDNDDKVYNTCGIAKRYAEHVIREIIKQSRNIAYEKAPPGGFKHYEMVRQMSNCHIPNEDLEEMDTLSDEYEAAIALFYEDFSHDMIITAETRGKHIKFKVINMLKTGGVSSVDFFVPEIVQLASFIKLLWLGNKYNAPIFTAGYEGELDDSIDFFQ